MNSASKIEKLRAFDRERLQLERIVAVLQWDQETYLPQKGVEERADQLALLEGLAHERATDREIGKLLAELGSTRENPGGDEGLTPADRDFLRVLRREYDRRTQLPGGFVREAAKAEGLSQAAWVNARKNDDFSAFKPHLERMIDISRRKAAFWGFQGEEVYDALLDCYEPGFRAAEIAPLFDVLRERLSALIRKIPREEEDFLTREYDVQRQAQYSRLLMEKIMFDTSRGRLDVSAHPFTITLGSHDVRITTRYIERNFLSSVFSTLHESGHGFYELNIAPPLWNSILGDGASMGIHESQSRLWENVIGRSVDFWAGQLGALRETFPENLSGISLERFYRGINQVKPSLIRIEADEVSYSLHIILRFELERKLFRGELSAEDLPRAWREGMKDLLGIVPEKDSQGVLQDVHWSMGSFGYFPSYALGNLYGLQFWRKLQGDLGDIKGDLASGNFSRIHGWLRENIHAQGRRLDPPDLLRSVTGESLSASPFLEYIETKYAELYGI